MRTPDDARRDPKPGDVFRKGRTWRRFCLHENPRIGCSVRTVIFRTKNDQWQRQSLGSFLRWAKDADVLEVANG